MESESNQPDKIRKSSAGALIVRPAIYSVWAVLIYFLGNLSWWLGVTLLVVFAFYVLVELLVNGLVLVIVAFILKLVFRSLTNYRVLNSEKFNTMQESAGSAVGISAVLVVVQLYYLLLILLLGFYFFELYRS